MGGASQELTDRAKLLIAERRYQEAVRACRRALLSQPDQAEIRLLLGEALLALERYDEVRVEMMALARKLPNRADVQRVLGEAYLRDGRPQQAVEALRRALQLDPTDEVAKELLCEAADENAPVSTTIERWFADEAPPTVEMEAPEWMEETTPVPATAASTRPPPVEIDPSLTRAAKPALAAEPSKAQPRVRSRQPTLAGQAASLPIAAPAPLRAAPPPRAVPAPELPRVASPAPSPRGEGMGARGAPAGARSPGEHAPGAPFPPRGAAPVPAPRRARVESPFPAPGPTSVQRPSARTAEPITEEFDLGPASGEDLDDGLLGAPMEQFVGLDLIPDELSGQQTDVLRHDMAPVHRIPTYREPGAPSSRGPAPLPVVVGGPSARSPAPASIRGEFHAPPPASGPLPSKRAIAPSPSARGAPSSKGGPPHPSPGAFASPPAPARAGAPARSPAAETTDRAPRRRLLVPIAAAALVAVLLAVFSTVAITYWAQAREVEGIRDAARSAGDSGLRADLEAALERIRAAQSDDPELLALEARLLATLTFEHGADRAAAAEALLARVDGRPADAHIAASLLDLRRGEPTAAFARLRGLSVEGEQRAEAFRARALVTAAGGDLAAADVAAAEAATLRHGAPRHVALHALMRHRADQSAEALALLDAVPGGEQAPCIRVTRARVLLESGGDPTRALEEADAVLGELAARASPFETAWAHLLRASYAMEQQGDGARALAEANAAAEHPPPADEPFGMKLVETLLVAGAAEAANVQLRRLPVPAELDAAARALLTGEVALAVGDLAAAETALVGAAAGPRTSLLRAQVNDARGRVDEARPLYEAAMRERGRVGRTASVRLAAIAMRSGDSARAVTLLEPARAGAVDDLELIPLLARAYLAEGRVDQAQQVVELALSRRSGAAELVAARGAVLLRRGELTQALASLRPAAQARPRDPELQADLGEAARRAGEGDVARTAFEAALALRPEHPRALLGLARLALGTGDAAEAERRLQAAERTGREGLEVAQVRAQLHVHRGDGAAALAPLEALVRRHDDAEIWTALGHLQAQAEQDRDAGRSYARALRRDRTSPEALLGQSLLDLRRGNLPAARRAITTATEQGERRRLGAEFRARLAVARGRLAFENGDFDGVVRLATEAVGHDAHNGAAHLLLANVALERNENGIEHLRRAASGHAPPPEALGRLAPRLPRGEEACTLARRYLEVAPGGYDASDVRDVAAACR